MLSLSSLPMDVSYEIYDRLPIADQLLIMPQVSHNWKVISDNRFMNVAKLLLEDPQLTDDNIKAIIELAKMHNFIPHFLKRTCWFLKPKEVDKKEDDKKEDKGQVLARFHLGTSELDISCDPDTGRISFPLTELSNHKARFLFRACITTIKQKDGKRVCVTSRVLSAVFQSYFGIDQCVQSVFPSIIESDKVKPAENKFFQMGHLIRRALDLQVKMYIIYLTHLNLIAIRNENLSILSDESGLSFSCKPNGVIKNVDLNLDLKEIHLNLQIKKISKNENQISVLTWKSSDPNFDELADISNSYNPWNSVFDDDSYHLDCPKDDATLLFRGFVFASTARMLAEELHMAVEEVQ